MKDIVLSNRSPERPLGKGTNGVFPFVLGLALIFLYFFLLNFFFKAVFISANWSNLGISGYASIIWALWKGLRFDFAILVYLLLPAIFLYYAVAMMKQRSLKFFLEGYAVAVALVITSIWLADLQYFEESGKHFTYEALTYAGVSLLPIVSGAFKLHPFISWISILVCIGLAILTGLVIKSLLRFCLQTGRTPRAYLIFTLPIFIIIGFIVARGGLQERPLKIGHSCISASPYLNALCLNPIYSAFSSSIDPFKVQQPHFFSEKFNIKTTRAILSSNRSIYLSDSYPLLRVSPGTEQGNRKNIVIFILESWLAKEIGCLGGRMNVTPVFDNLAREGLLFTNFYASGMRSGEGFLSIFNSFPDLPLKPIIKRPTIYHTHWRSLSQILAEAGYQNVFICGGELGFDAMKDLLRFLHFHKIIDQDDFPPSVLPSNHPWFRYNDEDVMRRADQEFASQNGQPFFGVVYTQNTHSPFLTPPEFPLTFTPTSDSNRFLNALKYSDYSLKVFFDLAQKKPYFKNTIFIFVADHARTKDNFNYSNQHHIPLLIYSPDYIQSGVNPVVGSQTDLLPTILGLLHLKTAHVSWGRNLLKLPKDQGFAVSMAGHEIRWRESNYLIVDSLTDYSPLLFDLHKDPNCTTNVWDQHKQIGETLQTKLRAYISLSQTLFYQNRVYP